MLGRKNAWQCYKDNEIGKEKCLLVQVAGAPTKSISQSQMQIL